MGGSAWKRHPCSLLRAGPGLSDLPGTRSPIIAASRLSPVTIDWPALRAAASTAAARAYAPYSQLRVGAAGQTADGQIVLGCNVENASYGLTLCAECGLVSALYATSSAEKPQLVAVAVVAGDGAPLLPCGRCRQLLLESGGSGLLVDTKTGPVPLSALLPAAFTGTDLAERKEPT